MADPPANNLPQALPLQLSALESLPDGIHGVIAALLWDKWDHLIVSAACTCTLLPSCNFVRSTSSYELPRWFRCCAANVILPAST